MVYLIESPSQSAIKIGIALDPVARLREHQGSNPDRLVLRCVAPGGRVLERHFHNQMREARTATSREWFRGPQADEFVPFMLDFCTRSVAHFEENGKPLIPILPPRRPPSKHKGMRSGAFSKGLQSRWRTSTGEPDAPITVRYVAPDPRPSDERPGSFEPPKPIFASASLGTRDYTDKPKAREAHYPGEVIGRFPDWFWEEDED